MSIPQGQDLYLKYFVLFTAPHTVPALVFLHSEVQNHLFTTLFLEFNIMPGEL